MPKQSLYDELGQFTAIPEKVIEMIPEIGTDAAILYLYFRYRTNKERGGAWPGYECMQKDLNWGRQKISNNIKKLEEVGLLARKKRFGASTIYYLKRPQDMGVVEEETDSSTEIEQLQESQKYENETTVVQKSNSSSTKTALKLDSINQIEKELDLKDSSAEKQADNGRPPKAEYNRLRKLAEDTWYEITKCPQLTNQKAKYKRVYAPLIEILDMVKWNEDDMFGLLYATYDQMKNLTFDAPDQWVKTARSIVGKANDGTYKPKYSFQAEMNKFLEGSRDGK